MLRLERLEMRDCPAGITVDNGVLNIVASDNGSLIAVTPLSNNSVQVVAYLDLQSRVALVQSYTGVNSIRFEGGAGADVYFNNTRFNEVVNGNGGNDALYSGFGVTIMNGGAGSDVFFVRATRAEVTTGTGANDFVAFLYGTHTASIVRAKAGDVIVGATRLDTITFS